MTTAELPPVFTLDDARALGLRKDQVYAMVATGSIERTRRGVFLRQSEIDPAFEQLAAATALRPEATMCLTSALVHHDLSDVIPFATDIALPRGVRHPAAIDHAIWHSFSRATFMIGREDTQVVGSRDLAIYSAERTILDCFRLKHQEGEETAYEALRRWLRRRGSSPSTLITLARAFPRTEAQLRHALAVLL